jgi:hypothetical protein
MRICILLISFCSLLINPSLGYTQDKPAVKFGRVTPEDFAQPLPTFDSGEHAVIIADIGYSHVTPNNTGGFGYQFERKMRVRIVDQGGLDAGRFEFPIYFDGNAKEEVKALKGITYNLEDGKVVETKLENNQVFTEKTNRNYQEKKFSLPALKAGSIFELSYTIVSDFIFDFRPWEFQGKYPCFWSEYEVEIPEFHEYVILTQGYQAFHITKQSTTSRNFMIRDNTGAQGSRSFSIDGMVNQKRWVMKDVPALKQESFTTTVNNHRSKIEFQLSVIRYPNSPPHMIMQDWAKVSESMMENENFGLYLDRNNGWLDDVLKPVLAGSTDQLQKAQRIFEYVRDNFTCVSRNNKYASTGLKNMLKTKSGNVADVNLLMIAMLKHEKIECYPVLLSTRSHGVTHEFYPLMDRFNYVACAAMIGDNDYLLDASVPDLGFGRMDLACYNGHARVLTKDPIPVYLTADSLLEKKMTLAFISAENHKIKGSIQENLGYYESLGKRALIRDKGKELFFTNMKTAYGSDFEISNLAIDSLKKLNDPLKISYDIELKNEEEDVLYINPVLVQDYKENPFNSIVRRYPVEMPYRIDKTYILNLDVPAGYVVDELPKSAKVGLGDGEGYFEYLIGVSGSVIQLRTRVVLQKATFMPEEYEGLRDFFGYIVKKQAEQIVLKKK